MDLDRRAWVRRACARAVAFAVPLGLLVGLEGALVGLLAVPLTAIEAWATPARARHTRAVLVAWALALVWLTSAHLQPTYVGVLRGQRGINPSSPWGDRTLRPGDVGAALEAVRIELRRISYPFGSYKAYTRPGTAPWLLLFATTSALILALRLGASLHLVALPPALAALSLIALGLRARGDPTAGAGWLVGLVIGAPGTAVLGVGLVMLVDAVADVSARSRSATERIGPVDPAGGS